MDTPNPVSPTITDLMPIGRAVHLIQRHYPSVTPSSLRFLEREGLIAPTRTAGGHRLYSYGDIQRILHIKSWQHQRLSLDQIKERLRERDQLPDIRMLANEFLKLIADQQLMRARALVMNADLLGIPLVAIFGEVLQPALYEIGARWQDGRFLVAQEKEASELLRDIIAELSHRHDPGPSGSFVVVAGCVQGERHELGLRMITGLLRSRGFRVHSLGADVNAAFFSEAVRLHRPEALLLSVKLVQNLDRVREVAESIRAALDPEPPPLVLVGGEAVGTISEKLAGVNVTVVQGSSLAGVIDSLTWHLESARGTRPHPEST